MTNKCDRCGTDGAGSSYNGGVYHMTCKLEQKRVDGVLGPTPEAREPRRKKTGVARFKRLNGGPRT